ncbi:unnamed protein product [Bursaphelenchus xylophilus]|uniref:(pine wood nematode) hypothetical protein n=1 Tax=Bursaphelenchus xylophilus TaxID=6326 RepID=A0A1I7RTM7_BURXY|nr:unnamed protein product [Bursaphelenchus xylophilus]CAG9122302.1 unnamed protein product [Bursaphelenchus xylophilus]
MSSLVVLSSFLYLVVEFVTDAKVYYRKLPLRFKPISYSAMVTYNNVADINDCVDLLAPQNVAFIYFSLSQLVCEGHMYTVAYGFYTEGEQNGTSPVDYVYYVRDIVSCGCASGKRTEQLLAQYTFFENICPPFYNMQYDPATRYCFDQASEQNSSSLYGNKFSFYRVGVDFSNNVFMLNRAQAMQTVKYDCDGYLAFATVYNNQWYCYMVVTTGVIDVTAVTRNLCPEGLKDGYPIKIIHPLIYGQIHLQSYDEFITGIVTYNGLNYTYFDNTTLPSGLRWATGEPAGKPMVIVSDQLELVTVTNSTSGTLTCLGPVTASKKTGLT